MTTITSQHNPRLKELRKLHRTRDRARLGLFLAEGEDLVLAAHAAGRTAVEGFRTSEVDVGAGEFHEVTPAALDAVSTLGSGTRAIGVYEQRYTQPTGPVCVYLHGVADPGNVGTVMRGALAFGASCVALGANCADPHSPKAVRASMGAIFPMALARVDDVSELPGEKIALVAHGGEPLAKVVESLGENADAELGSDASDPGREPVTLLVGAERAGLPSEIVEACDRVAHIPIAAESLNAAMAASVALYELTRRSTRVLGS